jgi:hypothetical protein
VDCAADPTNPSCVTTTNDTINGVSQPMG